MISKVTGTAVQAQASNLYHKVVADHGISMLISVLTLICIFTPPLLFFKQIAANTLYIMLGLLAFGFVFFLLQLERLMIVSFFCCCLLCLHLKSTSNTQMRLAAVTANPSLTISHINLANAENDYDSVVNYLLDLHADFISFQELTPDWNAALTERLAVKYHYIHTMTRLDQYGMGFFSKFPFTAIDTFYYQDVPTLACSIQMDQNNVSTLINMEIP